MTKLESLLSGYAKAEPQSEYRSDVIIIFDKNANKRSILKKLREYNLNTRKLSMNKYMLSPSDGESRDILRDYVWEYFENK